MGAKYRVEGVQLPDDVNPTIPVIDAILLAVKSLHRMGITHGDLAPRNIIVQGGKLVSLVRYHVLFTTTIRKLISIG
jgi:tRNA A-37 threonylcarbamoyl transferase component Bud32